MAVKCSRINASFPLLTTYQNNELMAKQSLKVFSTFFSYYGLTKHIQSTAMHWLLIFVSDTNYPIVTKKGVPSSRSVHLSGRTIVIFQLSWFLAWYSIITLYILCLRPGTCYYFKQTVFTDVVYYSLTHTGKILASKFNQVFLSSRWAPLQQASLGF